MRFSRGRSRIAASEAVGAMLAIAMTLVAGAAAWGFVNSQAGVSEGALNSDQVATDDMLSEHFAVVDMYFGTTTTATFMVYNTGSLTFQIASVRLYDSAGLVNILYSSSGTGASKADYVYDLKSTVSTECKAAASTYESPSVTTTNVKVTDEELYTLTIPPSGTGGCSGSQDPSYGQTFAVGTTYTVVVTGLYGTVQTFSQQDG